jgi:hypothetical protein
MKSFSLFCLRSLKFLAVCGSITWRRPPQPPGRVARQPVRTQACATLQRRTRLAHVVRQLIHQRRQAAALQHEAARHGSRLHAGGGRHARARQTPATAQAVARHTPPPRARVRARWRRRGCSAAARARRACDGPLSDSCCVWRFRLRVFAIAPRAHARSCCALLGRVCVSLTAALRYSWRGAEQCAAGQKGRGPEGAPPPSPTEACARRRASSAPPPRRAPSAPPILAPAACTLRNGVRRARDPLPAARQPGALRARARVRHARKEVSRVRGFASQR